MITMAVASWADFKAILAAKLLTVQISDFADRYELYAPEANSLIWFYLLPKDGGDDQVDFERILNQVQICL
jgi:hypothetical protein